MPVSSIPFVRRKDKADSVSRKDRKDIRDFSYETVGGVVGGALGSTLGPLGGIAGAGLGSAAGRGYSLLEDRLEYGEQPGQTAQGVMRELGESAMWGAGGEGLGRLLPAAGRGLKNIAKRPFAQTPEAEVLSKLADKYGIPLNLAERSGKTWLRLAEVGLDRLPFATNTIRKARREQYKAWTDAVNGVLDDVHQGNVTLDEFAVKAEDAFAGLRETFNRTVDEKVAAAGTKIRPTPATPTEAGRALQRARKSNLAGLRAWANKEYGAIEGRFGDVGIPMADLSDGLQEISPAAEQLFAPKAKNTIDAARRLSGEPNPDYYGALQETAKAIGLNSIEELQQRVPQLYQKEVERLVSAGVSPISGGGNIPYSQVAELRTAVLESIARLSKQPNSADVNALYDVLNNLNSAVERGFERAAAGASGEAADALRGATTRIKQANSTYRAEMRRLNPPRGAKDEGNIAAGLLNDTRINPDQIPSQIVNSKTMIEGAAAATSPDAMAALQRSKFDDMVRGSTVEAPGSEARVSPKNFRANVRKFLPMADLFERNAPDVAEIGGRDLAAREATLYSGQLPRAVDSGSGKTIISSAFPPKSPNRVGRSLELFEEAGIKPEAQRAYLDNIVESGFKSDPSLGPDKYLSGEKFGEAMAKTGDTFSTVVGGEASGKLDDLADVGRSIRGAEKEFGNPSGTARSLELLGVAGAIATAPFAPAAAAAAGGAGVVSNLAARAFTNPNLAKALTSAPRPVLPMLRRGPTSPTGRMVGQAVAQRANQDQSFFGVPMPQPIPPPDQDPDLVLLPEDDPDLVPLN
jgi:hypothetical protein